MTKAQDKHLNLILIIGCGLIWLTLAYRLKWSGIDTYLPVGLGVIHYHLDRIRVALEKLIKYRVGDDDDLKG